MMAQMKLQLLAIVFAVTISVGYARNPKKIVNGQRASITEIPHQVSLQSPEGFPFCGGTIIGAEYILTAAHCIVDIHLKSSEGAIDIITGSSDRTHRISENVFHVVRRIRHDYNHSDSNRNDIAILKVDRPIQFNNSRKPAKLPVEDASPGTRVISSGWGTTTYNSSTQSGHNFSQYLQKVEKIVMEHKICQDVVRKMENIGSGQICVQSQERAGVCFGDSGGPLTYNDVVIGVASFVFGCAQGKPDIYTRVHHYVPWIEKVRSSLAHNLPFPKDSREFVEVEPID